MNALESPASTIRRAAERLRACRLPARALDGRWTVGEPRKYDGSVPVLAERGNYWVAHYVPETAAAYIALVDPVVGAALADWLDSEAQAAETWADMIADSSLDRSGTHALRIARAILRETGESDG